MTVNNLLTVKNGAYFKGGKNTFNSSTNGWLTHFPFSDGQNFIRGDTIVDGMFTVNGHMASTGNLSLNIGGGGGSLFVKGNSDVSGDLRVLGGKFGMSLRKADGTPDFNTDGSYKLKQIAMKGFIINKGWEGFELDTGIDSTNYVCTCGGFTRQHADRPTSVEMYINTTTKTWWAWTTNIYSMTVMAVPTEMCTVEYKVVGDKRYFKGGLYGS